MRAIYHVDDFRALPLDRLAGLVRHLPDTSAVGAIGRDGPHWSVEAQLLDDVRQWLMIVAGAEAKYVKPHPQRPRAPKTVDPARQKKLIDARKRSRDRRRAIEAGEIT